MIVDIDARSGCRVSRVRQFVAPSSKVPTQAEASIIARWY